MVAYLEANTVQFEQGFGRATQTVGTFGRATEGSVRGLGMAERGLQNLAFRAAGVEGPLGKATEGLLMFAGGSPLVLGVATGIGAITLVMKLMNEEAEEAKRRFGEVADAAAKMRRTPMMDLVAQRATAATALKDAEAAAAGSRVGLPSGFGMMLPGAMKQIRDYNALKGSVASRKTDVETFDKQIEELIVSLTDDLISHYADGVRAGQARIAAAMADPGKGIRGVLYGQEGNRQRFMKSFSDAVGGANFSNTGGPLTLDLSKNAHFQDQALENAARKVRMSSYLETHDKGSGLFKFQGITAQSAGLAGINALSGALNGGGPGAFLSGGLSLAGGAFGPVGSALGGLLGQGLGGLFGRGESEEVRQLKLMVAEQKRTNDFLNRQYQAQRVLIARESDISNPANVDRFAREIQDATDRGVIVQVRR